MPCKRWASPRPCSSSRRGTGGRLLSELSIGEAIVQLAIATEQAKLQTFAGASQALFALVSWSQGVCRSKCCTARRRHTRAKACPAHGPNRQLILVESTQFKRSDKLAVCSWQSRLLYFCCSHAEAFERLVKSPQSCCPSSQALLLSLAGQQVPRSLENLRSHFHGWQRIGAFRVPGLSTLTGQSCRLRL